MLPERTPAPARRHALLGAALVGVPLVLGLGTALPAVAATTATPVPGTAGANAAVRQADLVVDEDNRLDQAQVALRRLHRRQTVSQPTEVNTPMRKTLVLPTRSRVYTLPELAQLAPDGVTEQSDGSYLVRENLVVDTGARLLLTPSINKTVKLASDANSFASIVSLGGTIQATGTPDTPMTIESWDETANRPDSTVEDGRAYVRGDGGALIMQYVDVRELGFWSGRTGGMALTSGESTDATADPTAEISHSSFTGDAFGLFISGAVGVSVADSAVRNSLVEGLVLHGGTTKATVERTSSSGGAGDGFTVARGSFGATMTDDVAADNAGHGFVLSGEPLADGPSESGAAPTSFGDLHVVSSTASGNRGSGVMVAGGNNVQVDGNTVLDNNQGIVVRDAATAVSVQRNRIERTARDAVVVTDSTRVTVAANAIVAARQGVLVRGSQVLVQRNTVAAGSLHGISLSADNAGTSVTGNTLAGKGRDAIDLRRAVDPGSVTLAANNTRHWRVDFSPALWLKNHLQPITVLWLAVLALLILGVSSKRKAAAQKNLHPYWQTQPVAPRPTRSTLPTEGGDPYPTGLVASTRTRVSVHSS